MVRDERKKRGATNGGNAAKQPQPPKKDPVEELKRSPVPVCLVLFLIGVLWTKAFEKVDVQVVIERFISPKLAARWRRYYGEEEEPPRRTIEFQKTIDEATRRTLRHVHVKPRSGQTFLPHFEVAFTCLAHPAKEGLDAEFDPEQWDAFGGGEDAGFVYPFFHERINWDPSPTAQPDPNCPVPKPGQESVLWIGLADGVGGWSKYKGARPQDFSRYLTQYSRDFLDTKATSDELREIQPFDVVVHSWDQILQNPKHEKLLGSSTYALLRIDAENMRLDSINIGDSGYVLISPDESKPPTRAKETLHKFNFPYQLASKAARRTDYPTDAHKETHDIAPGDIILAMTDGVLDNLFEKDMASFARARAPNQSMVDLTLRIAAEARRNAYDETWLSPFAKDAKRAGKTNFSLGGKLDDICVVAAKVLSRPSHQDQNGYIRWT